MCAKTLDDLDESLPSWPVLPDGSVDPTALPLLRALEWAIDGRELLG